MINRRTLTALFAALALIVSTGALAAWWSFSNDEESAEPGVPVSELQWDDLIPDDFVQPENPFISMSQEEIDKLMDGSPESQAEMAKLQEAFNYAPVVPELSGKRVKIPAYITPLEYNPDNTVKEFLLVPYVGACIHVPPPPANQIVHAVAPEAIKLDNMYDPVWAVGVIHAETTKSDLAESGYRLDVEEVMPYTMPRY
jgi:hypothetical protein